MKFRFIFALLIFAVLGVLIIRPGEPSYHGQTLTHWLQQYEDSSLAQDAQRVAEAKSAVQVIGATNGLPTLLKLVEARDNPISLWIIDKGKRFRISDRWVSRFFKRRSAEDSEWLGRQGFEIFGTNAAPAANELGKLLNEEDNALVAERCLESVGKPAEGVVCQALTNSHPIIRQWAINQLASVTDDVVVYINRIKPSLKDSSDVVRRTTVDAIGIQTSAPELAVPLLVGELKDPSVSANAANGLANFGTNSLITFSILTNVVEDGNGDTASAALKTLIIVAPNKSLPILTNCIVRGRPTIWGALEALRDVAPDEALPVIIGRFQSGDIETKRRAFRLLCLYQMTSKIEPEMQIAAADSDDRIAGDAKMILTEKYQQEHPLESQFSNDPFYDGMPLGEWLTMCDANGYLFPAATNAIWHIGTNAIPTLLQRLTYRQPPFGLPTPESNLIHMEGVRGFIALGTQSAPALPNLCALMDGTNENIVLYAMVASLGTGTGAIPILSKGLTNQFASVRNEAAQCFAQNISDQFPERRKEVIPLLTDLLNDPDPDIRLDVKGYLEEMNSTNIAKLK